MGRPSRIHEELVIDDGQGGVRATTIENELIRLAQTGAKHGIICDCVGISRHTLRHWLNWGNPDWTPTNDADEAELPDDREPYFAFFSRWRIARGRPAMVAEAAWLKAAKEGDWRASKAWLESHRQDEFADEITVNHQGHVGVTHDIVKVLDDYAGAFDDDEGEAVPS